MKTVIANDWTVGFIEWIIDDTCLVNSMPLCFNSVLEQLGGKTMVMSLLAHEDPNVRYEALLAVQKLMVHNW